MDKLGIDKAHMAGTSTGGCVLQNLAIDHPERLRCCIFSNTWVKADEYITRVQMTTQAHRAVLRAGRVRQGLVAVHQRRHAVPLRPRQGDGSWSGAPGHGGAGRSAGAAPRHDADARPLGATSRKIKSPSLVVGTRDDATVPSYQSEDLDKAIPGSRWSSSRKAATIPTAATGRSGTGWSDAFLEETEGSV